MLKDDSMPWRRPEAGDDREALKLLLVTWDSRLEDEEVDSKILERKWNFSYLKSSLPADCALPGRDTNSGKKLTGPIAFSYWQPTCLWLQPVNANATTLKLVPR